MRLIAYRAGSFAFCAELTPTSLHLSAPKPPTAYKARQPFISRTWICTTDTTSAMTANGDQAVGQLVEQLAVGFDTLSSEYRILYDRHRELENKLAWAKQQVRYQPFLPHQHPSRLEHTSRLFMMRLLALDLQLLSSHVDNFFTF